MEGYIAIIFVAILLGIWIFSIIKAYLTEQEKKTEYKNSEYFSQTQVSYSASHSGNREIKNAGGQWPPAGVSG